MKPSLALLWLLACVCPALAARPALPPVEGEVIVKFKADAGTVRSHALAARAEASAVRSALTGRASALGARMGRTLEAGAAAGERTQVVRASGMGAAALAAQLAADPDVEYAVPNQRARIAAAPNDPYYLVGPAVSGGAGGPVSGQWYLRAPNTTVVSSIDIEAAWSLTTGSPAIVVAVLDTGVRKEHPDLSGRLLDGYDFVSNATVAGDGNGRDADASDPGDYLTTSEILADSLLPSNQQNFKSCTDSLSSWHGTSTASLVGAATNDRFGMAGTAPGVKILPLRVLGKCGGVESDILAAMRWAAGLPVDGMARNPNPAKVLNLSLGGGTCDAAYQAAVNEVIAAGVVIVAAAGNDDGRAVEAPASCAGVIGVAGLRHAGTKNGFSSLGPEVVIAAPGGNCVDTTGGACLYPILAATDTGSTTPVRSSWTDSFNYTLGTSFSSPLVAGVVGLMLSRDDRLTPAQVRTKLTLTARPFPSSSSDPSVPVCQAPSASRQAECHCTTSTCGAGMLDAGAALASVGVTGPTARIAVTPAAPTALSPVLLSGSGSTPNGNAAITGYQWSVTDAGGIAATISNATSASANWTPAAAGTYTVSLAVSDGLANIGLATQTVTVAPAPVTTPPVTGGGGSGGGGGAFAVPWLALLALAVIALFRMARRRA
jgi:serine protease